MSKRYKEQEKKIKVLQHLKWFTLFVIKQTKWKFYTIFYSADLQISKSLKQFVGESKALQVTHTQLVELVGLLQKAIWPKCKMHF